MLYQAACQTTSTCSLASIGVMKQGLHEDQETAMHTSTINYITVNNVLCHISIF